MGVYNSLNKIKFTSISERYQVPRRYRASVSELHASLISYVCNHFSNTLKYKQQVTDALNILTYCVLENETPPFDWSKSSPLNTMPDFNMDNVAKILGGIYLTVDGIDWDVSPTDISNSMKISDSPVEPAPQPAAKIKVNKDISQNMITSASIEKPSIDEGTQKEDLYIRSPIYPRFDYSKPWLSQQDGPDKLVIYTTLPEIPTKQNEISVTTEVSMMSDAELMKLYPTRLIRTRAAAMYEAVDGLKYDSDVGLILPVEGFTEDQLVDNVIRYPHLYKLQRVVDGNVQSFYTHIEIDGELIPVDDCWDSLPESSVIPKQSEFIKEYVVRRYLLEEENGIQHKYSMYGTLLPYLTLFMPSTQYISRGYIDVLSIARSCVESRVSFKRSRNPILRRLNLSV